MITMVPYVASMAAKGRSDSMFFDPGLAAEGTDAEGRRVRILVDGRKRFMVANKVYEDSEATERSSGGRRQTPVSRHSSGRRSSGARSGTSSSPFTMMAGGNGSVRRISHWQCRSSAESRTKTRSQTTYLPGGWKSIKVVEMDSRYRNEKKKLVTFSIEPSFKEALEEIARDKGLSWSALVRMALREFARKHQTEIK